jgi:transcriptional regulator with XRE-family HTH domain
MSYKENFGERLARFRQTAGFSQRGLATKLGITADQLLGIEKSKDIGKGLDKRLWRRFSQVEKLPPPKRKQIVQILDAFLESEKFKKAGQL